MMINHMDFKLLIIKRIMLFVLLIPHLYQPLIGAENSPEWLYRVRPGDTLIHFGNRHLINPDDWRVLQKLNHIKNPYRMPIGSKMRVPLHLLKQVPAQAEVIFASGGAFIINGDKSRQAITVGQKLNVGTELQTIAKSKLNIRFADGSIVTMQPNSTLKLDTLSMYSGGGMVDTKLRLQQGGVEIEANPSHTPGNSMQIFTPTAVAAVRGTSFRVSAESQTVRQETLTGQVALAAAGQEVAIDKGYGSLSADGNAPLPPVLLLAAPDVSKLIVQFETLPVEFTMPAQKDAVAWVGSAYQDAQLNILAAENMSQSGQLTFVDLPDGQYTLKVRAKDSLGLEGFDAVHAFSLNARPYAPAIVYPAAAEKIREPKPTLRWGNVNQANSYQLELANDAEFKQIIMAQQVVNTQFTLENALQPGQYFWRLASLNQSEKGPYSAINHFVYKPKPPAPDISQLVASVIENRVFINTLNPPSGFFYEATLDNEQNHQKNVWQAVGLNGRFDFLLREYGKQTLRLRLVDAEGVAGPEAVTEFDGLPPR